MRELTREEIKWIKETLNCRHCGKGYGDHYFGTTICSHQPPEVFDLPGASFTSYSPDEKEIEKLLLSKYHSLN